MKLRVLILAVLLLIGGFPSSGVERHRQSLSIQCGDMDFFYSPSSGIRLSVFDITIINGASFWVVQPGWVSHIYGPVNNPRLLEKAIVEEYEGGKKITLFHSLPADFNCPFEGVETFILKPDNSFSTSLRYRLTEDVPADIEWGLASLAVDPIIGRPFQYTGKTGSGSGVIPVKPLGSALTESMVARDFSSLQIDSRIGPIGIQAQQEAGLLFFDYRKNIWADANKPLFWMGIMDGRIQFGKQYDYTVSFQFPKKSGLQGKSSGPVAFETKVKKVGDARVPNWGQDYILPTPKHLKYTGQRFPLSSKTLIYLGAAPGVQIENALAFLLKDMKDLFGIEPRILKEAPPVKVPKGSIVVGEAGRFAAPARMCKIAGLDLPENPEGYSLLVRDNAAYVAANTETGVFYGLTTLLQLSAVDNQGIYLKGAEIVDYPSLAFRGVHCLSGKNAGDQIAKMIRTLMARFKMNSLVWECEYIVWDSCPELEHPQYGMTKADAQKVIDAARDNFVELIPLVQSLGHSEWIFTNNQNLDIAEDPETPYAYNPTDPRTYEFIFKVFQEALDFFQPKYFHIGHDEVTMRGRFPWRSRESGKSVTQLVLEDTIKLRDWFDERDVRTMLWGDMFLYKTEAPDATFAPSAEEAQLRRSLLPKDIIVTDWHYAPRKPEEYTSIPLWKREGFPTIGSGWFNPLNIANLAKACVDAGAEGYLQTTWAGFNFAIDGNEEAWYQYWAYILAAEYAWSGVNTPVEQLPFKAEDLFLDLWSERKPLLENRKGFFVDLQPVFNRRLSDDAERSGWMGYGPELDFSSFPVDRELVAAARFRPAVNEKGEGALLLAGKMNPAGQYPAEVSLELKGQKASSLHFLMNAGFRGKEGGKAGEIVVVFEDGTKDRMDLLYGKNLFSQTDERVGMNARIAWEGEARDGNRIRVWDLEWVSPKPTRKIDQVILRSSGSEAAPVLFALTGVE